MIRLILPTQLRQLAGAGREVQLQVEDPATLGAVLDALEADYPVLRGTIRDHSSKQRRDFIRYFACGEDLSHLPDQAQLPGPVNSGEEPLRIVGALAGG